MSGIIQRFAILSASDLILINHLKKIVLSL